MSEFNKIVRNTISLVCSGAFSQGMLFFINAYLARYFEPAGFGTLIFAQTVASYFVLISALGYNYFGTREVALHKQQLSQTVGRLLTLRALIGILAFVLLMAITMSVPYLRKEATLILLFGVEILLSIFFLDWVYQGLEEMYRVAIARIVNVTLYGLGVYIVSRMGASLLSIAVTYLIGLLCAVLVLVVSYQRKHGIPAFTASYLKIDLGRALPFTLTTVLNLIMFNINILIIAFYLDKQTVGIYSAYSKIVMLLIMVVGMYFNAIYPTAARLYHENRPTFSLLMNISSRLSIIIAGIIFLIGFTGKEHIISLIYGAAYVRNMDVFVVLLFMVVQVILNTVYGRGLLAAGKEQFMLKVMVLFAIVNIALNFVLIPQFGIVGAAFAGLVTEIIAFVLQAYYFNKIENLVFWKPLIKTSLLVAFLVIMVNLFNSKYSGTHWGLTCFAVTVCYLGGVWCFSIVSANDLNKFSALRHSAT